MATLENIRNRAGILVMVVIGLAMLGFILGDFNVSPNNTVAEIAGKTFSAQDYQEARNKLRSFYEMNYGQNLDPEMEKQIETETWNRLVRETVMNEVYRDVKIRVSTDELKAMVTGGQNFGTGSSNVAFNEPHPIVKQMFSNPQTGEFNRYIMVNYFNSLNREEYAQEKRRWKFIEDEIVNERKNQKYMTLVSKGLRPSSLEVKDHYMENGKSVDFRFVSRNFAAVSDDEITISDSDIKSYYDNHIESYQQEASRSIDYVVFEVVPSDEDDENARLWTQQTRAEFSRMEGDKVVSYVNSVSDEPFDTRYYSIPELSPLIRDSLLNAEDTEIFGPYYENESYKLSRIHDQQYRPDSVRARHILIGYSIVGSAERAETLADSLMTVLEEGGDFRALAMEYSADENNSSIGGDLGWFNEGEMETEFNDACFENSTGDLVTATTQYGIHIIRIDDQSRPVEKVQVATIVHNVIPSNATDQEYYNRAVKFRSKATNLEKFEEQATEFGLDPRVVPTITKDQRTVPGLENPVEIIGWAFSAELEDVSNIFVLEDKYVVAALSEVNEEGYADLESVRSEIEVAVKKEKKGEKIGSEMEQKMDGATDLDAFAARENLSVGEASQVKFANAYVTGIGMEPFVVGASMHLPVDLMSGPFIGDNGVFLISVTNRNVPDEQGNMSASENRLQYSLQARTNYEAYNALVEHADVEDNRLKVFYGRR